mgnify:CR=1 FL=1
MKQKNIDYINVKGLDVIRQHAQDFIAKREAPAFIPNDGKQTPTQGCTMSSGHRLCTDRSGAETTGSFSAHTATYSTSESAHKT